MEIKRILHVVGQMHFGGMETLIMNIYRHLDRSKFQFDFLVHYNEPGDYDEEIKELGGKIYHMPPTTVRNFFIYREALTAFFKAHHNYVAVHGHLIRTAFMYHKIAHKQGVPVTITHAHAASIDKNLKSYLGYMTAKMALSETDLFFACSDKAAKFYFGDRRPAYIIKNGVEATRYIYTEIRECAMRRHIGLADSPVIMHIGRFVDVKNHQMLINIFRQITDKVPDAKLVLIGTGPLKKDIEHKVADLGMNDSVIFLGNRSDICDLLQIAQVFIMPSKYEGLPVSAIEAQAAGLPCLLSDTISRQVDISGKVQFISLKTSCEEWAKKAIECFGMEKKDQSDLVKKAGFDICDEVGQLERIYDALAVN